MRASQGTGMMDSTIGGSRLLREREALSKGYFSLFLFASVLIGDRDRLVTKIYVLIENKI